jgi:hypothetical protein
VELEIEAAERAAPVDLQPCLGTLAMENVAAWQALDGFVWINRNLPTWKPSMQMVHFCLDFPIFMFFISFRYLCGNPLHSE